MSPSSRWQEPAHSTRCASDAPRPDWVTDPRFPEWSFCAKLGREILTGLGEVVKRCLAQIPHGDVRTDPNSSLRSLSNFPICRLPTAALAAGGPQVDLDDRYELGDGDEKRKDSLRQFEQAIELPRNRCPSLRRRKYAAICTHSSEPIPCRVSACKSPLLFR